MSRAALSNILVSRVICSEKLASGGRAFVSRALLFLAFIVAIQNANGQPRLVPQIGHQHWVRDVRFSPNGQVAFSSSFDRTIRVWKVDSGELLNVIPVQDVIGRIAVDADGKRIFGAGNAGDISCFDTQTGKLVFKSRVASGPLNDLAMSPDGEIIIATSEKGEIVFWEPNTRRLIRELTPEGAPVDAVCFCGPDIAATATRDGRVACWSIDSGEELFHLPPMAQVYDLAFDPISKLLYIAAADGRVHSISPEGIESKTFDCEGELPLCVTLIGSASRLAVCSNLGIVRIFDPASGRMLGKVKVSPDVTASIASNLAGTFLLTGGQGGVQLSSLDSRKVERRLYGKAAGIWKGWITPDRKRIVLCLRNGRVLVIGPDSSKAEIVGRTGYESFMSPDGDVLALQIDRGWTFYETSTLRPKFRIPESDQSIVLIAFSEYDRKFLCWSSEGVVKVWNLDTGKSSGSWKVEGPVKCLAFLGGNRALVATGNRLEIWDLNSRSCLRKFVCESLDLQSLLVGSDETILVGSFESGAISRVRLGDGKVASLIPGSHGPCYGLYRGSRPDRLVASYADGFAIEWDLKNLVQIRSQKVHAFLAGPMSSTSDGQLMLTSSGGDATARLWQADSFLELCSLVPFDDGTWAVVDPEGRYDASNGGDVAGLHWVVGMEPIALSQFKDYYYDPGLLAKKMGFSKEPLRDVPDLSGVGLYPESSVSLSGSEARVSLRSRGGGIGKVEVYVNGALVESPKVPPGSESGSFSVDLSSPEIARRLLPLGDDGQNPNRIEVVSLNAAGTLRSRGEVLPLPAPKEPASPPRLFAVVAGVSDYAGDRMDLRYAAQDARAFASALERAGEELFPGRVSVRMLASDEKGDSERPTRANLESALREASERASSTDVLVVYLAGHGVGRAGGKDGYFFVTSEGGMADVSSDPLAPSYTISGDELAGLMAQVPANKQALVLDTCASGAAAQDLSSRRDVTGDVRRAWERLKDRSGVYVLAGCASDAPSYEASSVGHGLLTYSLLEAVDRVDPRALREDAQMGSLFLDVDRWFGYAEDRVEGLVRELGIGGVQKPERKAKAGARSFDVGRLTEADRGRVALPQPRPVLLLGEFETRDREDPEGLTAAVEAALRQRTALAYWPGVRSHPGAFRIVGTYATEGEILKLSLILQRFDRETGRASKVSRREFVLTKGSDAGRAIAEAASNMLEKVKRYAGYLSPSRTNAAQFRGLLVLGSLSKASWASLRATAFDPFGWPGFQAL